MRDRIKVVDVELDSTSGDLGGLEGYGRLRVLARLRGTPIGSVEIPLPEGGLTAGDLRRIVLRSLPEAVIRQRVREAIERPLPPDGLDLDETPDALPPERNGHAPLVTVAVCTRDRAEDLEPCLDALMRLEYPRLDFVVVDNAPATDATERLVEFYPRVRYVREPRPGLDWARNRAIAEARGEVVAYTDDDVIVDPGWAAAIAAAFEDSQVMAVTGLVVPYELETEAQVLFERYGGFGRGFRRRYWRMDRESGERALKYIGAGQYGTGANMAYRKSIFERIGGFDPALDVGTVTNGGGDLEMFFRVVKEGHLLAYEPSAMVRHRHRRGYERLRTQLANNGVGFYSFFVSAAMNYPETRRDAARFALTWFARWSLGRLAKSFIQPSRFPRDLILAELTGSLKGLTRYQKARSRADRIAASAADEPEAPSIPAAKRRPAANGGPSVGVRMVDLCEPLMELNDVAGHTRVRVFVTLDGRLVGSALVENHRQTVSAARLRDAIADQLGPELLAGRHETSTDATRDAAEWLQRRLPSPGAPAILPENIQVSIVVATYDRPDDLRNCLRSLAAQDTRRPVEILVVDNHPASGLTPPVVAEFPEAALVTETRAGLAYARNRGFTASSGEVVVATDDDVTAPDDWLEKIVAPFARPEVVVVTGNALPLELETAAQRSFEAYGGLGRGLLPKEADGRWLASFCEHAVPTWNLGATANAAFRATAFAHPEIGLMNEALGAGTPTGCSEDTDFFYRVLKAGYTIRYEPSAYVWHRHRRDMHSLRSQLYNYSKGHVAYHLTTLLRDRDLRAAKDLAVRLPKWHARRLISYAKRRLLRKSCYPLRLTLLEIRGNLAGPWSLWRSHRRVRREGRSAPYVPVPLREIERHETAIGTDA